MLVTASPAAIFTEHLSVTFDGSPILTDIGLTVGVGEVVALLGPNGSGKSTLLRAVLGLVHHTGTVHLAGQTERRAIAWDKIGYVPQRSTASAGVPATAAEVVASGLLAGRRLALPRHSRQLATQALASVGLADRAADNVANLSGGQQQRVLIARALIRQPDLLLLDEPTAGVDLDSQRDFASTLQALAKQGRTIVVVLHEIGPYASLITRSIVLEAGRIASDSPAQRLGSAHDPSHPHGDPHHAHAAPEPSLGPHLGIEPPQAPHLGVDR
jgi:zinc transport system ATP-binding protein